MLSDREQLIEFLIALVCGNAARQVIHPGASSLDSKQMIQLATEFRQTNKLVLDDSDFADLIADVDHILEKCTGILVHLVEKGYLFKDDLTV